MKQFDVLHMASFLLAIVFMFNGNLAKAEDKTSVSARIAPVGKVKVQQTATSVQEAMAQKPSADAKSKPKKLLAMVDGKEIYENHCVVCHAQGVAGAPKLGDKANWDARVSAAAKRQGGLLASVKNGLNAMPAMGTCMECSEAELQIAIDYMLQAEG